MGVYKRKDSPYWQIWIDGTTQRENTKIPIDAPTEEERKANLRLAKQILNAHLGDIARAKHKLPSGKRTTFRKLAAWYETHHLERHHGQEREREILPKLVEAFGNLTPDAITQRRVHEWIHQRLTEPQTLKPIRPGGKPRTIPAPSARTVNREVDVLKSVLQAAVPTYIEASPLFGMKRLKVARPKRRLMTMEEEAKILAHLKPVDAAIFLLGLDSLLRLGDILDLRWDDIRQHRAWIAAPKDPKQPEPFWVPISARAEALIDQIAHDEKSPYVFSSRRRAKTERDRRNAYANALRRACKAADVPYGRTEAGITFHWATRRTGVTRMLTRDVDLGTAQKIGRWKTADVVLSVYHELLDDSARAAVEAVGPSGNRAGTGNAKRHRPNRPRHRAARRHRANH